MTIRARITISVWMNLDAYVLAETTQGIFSIFLDGSIRPGIAPLAAGVPQLTAPMEVALIRDLPCPAGLTGEIKLYLVITQAGRVPPVKSPAEVRPDSPFVIMMDKKTLTVLP